MRVPDDVVRLANQFFFREAAYVAKRPVDESDAAAIVGAGNDGLILGDQDFMVRNRLVQAHDKPPGRSSPFLAWIGSNFCRACRWPGCDATPPDAHAGDPHAVAAPVRLRFKP